MTDFTLIQSSVNSGVSDAAPTWTNIQFSTANHEMRLCGAGAGAGNIASASWPTYIRPSVTTAIPELWAYTGSDNSGGLKVTTYDGTAAHYMQWRINWDATGTFATAPILSAWKDSTLPAAAPGTQTATGDGSAFVNGQITDTGNTSYIKANAYGSGVTVAGVQETPAANAAGTLLVTSGTAGAVSPAAASWLATWQSLQSGTQFIQAGVIPKATTLGYWYICFSWFTGPNQTGGTLVPSVGVQYTWV